MALTTLSFSLSNLSGVGHTLDSAKALNQQASAISDKLKAVGQDIDGFGVEVEDCIARQHYEATHLSKLATSLQEKKGSITRTATERQRVISASVEFQQNVKNVSFVLTRAVCYIKMRSTYLIISVHATILLANSYTVSISKCM